MLAAFSRDVVKNKFKQYGITSVIQPNQLKTIDWLLRPYFYQRVDLYKFAKLDVKGSVQALRKYLDINGVANTRSNDPLADIKSVVHIYHTKVVLYYFHTNIRLILV